MKQLYRLFIELSHHFYLSKVIQKFTTSKVSRFLIPHYAKLFRINEGEMQRLMKEYPSLHELFIRKLKADARPIDQSEDAVVSPVDGTIQEIGEINRNKHIVVKGQEYSISEMVGDDRDLEKYIGGFFIICYLSPSDYHRIHSPINGEVTEQWTLGGHSYPVNKLGLRYGKAPLAKNFRRLTEIQTKGKHILMVKVGALFVNSIELTHKDQFVLKGEEVAYFSFGSTVILLFENGTFTPREGLVGQKIRYGENIGNI